jgi:hypothetical protein
MSISITYLLPARITVEVERIPPLLIRVLTTSSIMRAPIKLNPFSSPEVVPVHVSLEQYGTNTWFAFHQYGFSFGSPDRIPPTTYNFKISHKN